MDSYLLDWANLLLRWLHVIAAIAWIGASFLLRLVGQPPAQAAGPRAQGQGRGRRAVGAARRRLLQHAEVHGRAGRSPTAPALVLLGELLDLDERLSRSSRCFTSSTPTPI
ncbi:hypothetical protein Ddc_23890 [Ditylenchus destructor]|nr:hypothetical protein Ddc_23890 [Ditylenchus destructor]